MLQAMGLQSRTRLRDATITKRAPATLSPELAGGLCHLLSPPHGFKTRVLQDTASSHVLLESGVLVSGCGLAVPGWVAPGCGAGLRPNRLAPPGS